MYEDKSALNLNKFLFIYDKSLNMVLLNPIEYET
jgi:hypothetical protein